MDIKTALIQMEMVPDKGRNIDKALSMIEEASGLGARLVCLPELFTSPYFPNEQGSDPSVYEEVIPGPLSDRLGALSKELGLVLVAGSVFERAAERAFNTSMVFDSDGSLAGIYRKMHIPQDPGFYEKDYFAPGDLGFRVFQTSIGRIAPLICYDQWFPEAAREVSLMGADIIVYPTAIGVPQGVDQSEGDWHDAWRGVMRGHAISNSVAVAAINRVGQEDGTRFWGGSFVCSQFGSMLAEGDEQPGMVLADIRIGLGQEVREGWGFFRNRRPGTYSMISRVRP